MNFNHIPISDFKSRVLTSSERVNFTQIDPYGHLNANRYLESFINHRIAAAEDQLKCFTMDIATQQMTAFVIEQANVKYISPARLGEWIEIASWVCELHRDGFLLEAVVVDKNSRAVRAQAKLNFKSVNSKTGKPVPMLETLLSRSNESLLAMCPTREEYLSTIKPLAETSQRVS